LKWTGVSGATGYIVYQRDVTAGQGFTRLPIAVSGTSWTANLLDNAHVYEFKLRSQNLNGESGYSSTVSVKPVAVPPAAPGSFRAVPVDLGIQMSWAPVPNATGYWLYSRRHGSTSAQIAGYTKSISHRFGTLGSSRWEVWVVAERYGTQGSSSAVKDMFAFADDYDPGWSIWPLDQSSLWQNQCTAFAAWRVQLNHPEAVGFWNYTAGQLPHAKRWATAAQAFEAYAHKGVSVSSTPRVGDIAQWSYEPYGHVAFVVAVDGANIYLEEYNYTNPSSYDTRVVTAGSNYIHFASSA
jgi:surface antigen